VNDNVHERCYGLQKDGGPREEGCHYTVSEPQWTEIIWSL